MGHHPRVGRTLPSGTVTLLFTDIEGSTRLLRDLGPDRFAAALMEHRQLLREAVAAHGGVEVDTEGDALFAVFASAPDAVAAASHAQHALAGGIRVRMGLHTGEPRVTDEGYVGEDVHKAARIAASAHGGQVILSRETRVLLGQDVALLDLGEHRVKDFSDPVWLYQLGSQRFPPLRTISNTNLPRPASAIIGRSREVAEISALVRDGARLVTLTGPGGTGKTRLALEAAADLVPDFANGVFWVSLGAVLDPELVLGEVARTIGAKEGLAGFIGDRDMLLLLDNLEQVIAVAPELTRLVEQCPRLRLLVTSRERLRVRGEAEYPVPPLVETEAVALFCRRAGLDPDDAVRELCRHLDCLPLAIELAAARAGVLSPSAILTRLSSSLDLLKGGRDAEARQATLRTTIEWSHNLLSGGEQRLFACLAVFRGGCTLDAAEQVCDADLDVLSSLVDKSLVRRIGDRYSMLETVGSFAAERLERLDEGDAIRHRHAQFFAALAEDAFVALRERPGGWLDRLDRDHDNLRAALRWLETAGDTQAALGLAGALYRFWYGRGYLTEGRRRLEALLHADATPTAARARALDGAVVMALNTGDLAAGRHFAEEAGALHRNLGDSWGVAYIEYLTGFAAAEERDWDTALPWFEHSLAAFRELGDDHYTLLAMDGLAWVHGELGDRNTCRALHEETLRLARAMGDLPAAALQLDQLGSDFALPEGRVADALGMLAEALEINRELARRGALAEGLTRFAHALASAARPEPAAALLGAAEALREEIGGGSAWAAQQNLETRRALLSALDRAALDSTVARGRMLTLDEAVDLALATVRTADP